MAQQSFHGQEVNVAFNELSFTVQIDPEDDPGKGKCQGKPPKVPKTILKNLGGRFEHGKLTAIMGASGAGKTTMLNCIAGEASDGTIEGQVLINGQQIDSETMRRISAFVFQDDVILESMTVREAITLSARLRLPKNMSAQEKDKRVQQVIDVLHLNKCADTVCGSPTASGGISGGERKRTAIGMELITNPSVLFLDEPTTGLDTYTAFSVMDTLRQLAVTGRTVVATIHQPSSDTFHLFDNLLVLSEGSIVYQAPAAGAVEYFGALGFVCPHFTNPADFLFMQVLNVSREADGKAQAQAQRGQLLVDSYQRHPMAAESKRTSLEGGGGIDLSVIAERPGFADQVPRLMVRNLRNILRNPMGVRARLGQAITLGSIIALIYHGLGHDQASIQSRTGALFFVSMNMMMSSFSVLGVFFQEKIVFEREQSHGMYSTSAFFVTKILTELPMNVVFPMLQSTIIYFSLDLQPHADKFFIFAAVNVLNINAGQALGVFIASMFTDLRVTLVAAPPLILPLMIFSGFFINTESIPPYFDWIKYLSPIKYTFEALANNEFNGLTFHCADDEVVAHPSCAADQAKCFCPVTTGENVLQGLGMADNLTIAENIGCLVGLWSGMLVLAFLSLQRIINAREAKRSRFAPSDPAATKRRSLLNGSANPRANGQSNGQGNGQSNGFHNAAAPSAAPLPQIMPGPSQSQQPVTMAFAPQQLSWPAGGGPGMPVGGQAMGMYPVVGGMIYGRG